MPRKNKDYKKKGIIKDIEFDKDMTVVYEEGILSIKGEKGECKKELLSKGIKIEIKDNKIILESKKMNKRGKKILSSFEAHIKNLLKGSTEGHRYELKVCSGHFPMSISINNDDFAIKNFLGEKIPRKLKIKEGATVKAEGDQIVVESSNKEIAGQVSADIENLTRRPGYDSRIFQDGIYIVNKDGKEIK